MVVMNGWVEDMNGASWQVGYKKVVGYNFVERAGRK
jgi:hypothetical protein